MASEPRWLRQDRAPTPGNLAEKGLLICSLFQKTRAYHRLQDDVPAEVKRRRLEELISVFREEATRVNGAMVGRSQLVLVEGVSGTLTPRWVCFPPPAQEALKPFDLPSTYALESRASDTYLKKCPALQKGRAKYLEAPIKNQATFL